jgi:hypothetical protein
VDFLAALLGAAIGVVAGALIQYLAAFLINRYERRRRWSDLQIEAEYNLNIAEEMLNEVRRFRAAAQPATFANYQWYFRAKDMLSIALTRMVNSGELYRMFNRQEILDLQSIVQFFTPALEQNFANQIEQLKTTDDYAGAMNLANHLERQINDNIARIHRLRTKQFTPRRWFGF